VSGPGLLLLLLLPLLLPLLPALLLRLTDSEWEWECVRVTLYGAGAREDERSLRRRPWSRLYYSSTTPPPPCLYLS
jgi:hypothetical protein